MTDSITASWGMRQAGRWRGHASSPQKQVPLSPSLEEEPDVQLKRITVIFNHDLLLRAPKMKSFQWLGNQMVINSAFAGFLDREPSSPQFAVFSKAHHLKYTMA